MPLHALPVVQSLKRKLRILRDLQFNHDQSAASSDGKQIDVGSLFSSVGRNLGIHEPAIERRIERAYVVAQYRLQPPLRLQPVIQRAAVYRIRYPMLDDGLHQISDREMIELRGLRLFITHSKLDPA